MKKVKLNVARCDAISHTSDQYKHIAIVDKKELEPKWCTQYNIEVDFDVALEIYLQLQCYFKNKL